MAYVKSFELHYGAFNWNLHFRWYTLGHPELLTRKINPIAPFPTPAMAGGLFAIMKDYFFESGTYDEEMHIWGGENLEMSFRLWQCGGRVEIAPCSHIGHIFRKSSPYSFPSGMAETLSANLARVALVWMDEWGDFFFKFNPKVKVQGGPQNISKRLQLRKDMKCKSFEWYLDNIWPNHFFPKKGRFFGRIKHKLSNKCIMRPISKGIMGQPMGPATLGDCLPDNDLNGIFVISEDKFVMMDESICLNAPDLNEYNNSKPPKNTVRLMGCLGSDKQKWIYEKNTLKFVNFNGMCLQPDDVITVSKFNKLKLVNCTLNPNQQWELESLPWK